MEELSPCLPSNEFIRNQDGGGHDCGVVIEGNIVWCKLKDIPHVYLSLLLPSGKLAVSNNVLGDQGSQ